MDPLPLSGVVITLNEAANIERCLGSLSFCSELLVVDSGSTDDTADRARALGARVVHNPWPGFGPQKHFAVEQAEQDWVLCLDAIALHAIRTAVLFSSGKDHQYRARLGKMCRTPPRGSSVSPR
jgi:hypothetical protein